MGLSVFPQHRVVVRTQGALLDLRHIRPVQEREKPALQRASRGVVKVLSAASRRRLLRLGAALNANVMARFITLTAAKHTTDDVFRQAYDRFRKAMSRAYPSAAWIWRLERQKNGTLHMHLIAWRSGFIDATWLWDTWERCIGHRARVDIVLLKSRRGVLRYISKYVAKKDDTQQKPDTSLVIGSYLPAPAGFRWWGIHNKENIPFAETKEIVIKDIDDAIRYLTWVIYRDRFRKSYIAHENFMVMADDADTILQYLAKYYSVPISQNTPVPIVR